MIHTHAEFAYYHLCLIHFCGCFWGVSLCHCFCDVLGLVRDQTGDHHIMSCFPPRQLLHVEFPPGRINRLLLGPREDCLGHTPLPYSFVSICFIQCSILLWKLSDLIFQTTFTPRLRPIFDPQNHSFGDFLKHGYPDNPIAGWLSWKIPSK